MIVRDHYNIPRVHSACLSGLACVACMHALSAQPSSHLKKRPANVAHAFWLGFHFSFFKHSDSHSSASTAKLNRHQVRTNLAIELLATVRPLERHAGHCWPNLLVVVLRSPSKLAIAACSRTSSDRASWLTVRGPV